MAVQEGPTAVRLSWTPSSDATGYVISYNRSSTDSVVVNVGASSEQLLLTGLQNGATYTISLVATSQHLSSAAVVMEITLGKTEVSHHSEKVLCAVSIAGLPTLSVTSVTTTSISLSWSVPSISVVTSYEVMWQETGSGTTEVTVVILMRTSYNIEQLDGNTNYTISVTAANPAGRANSHPIIISTGNGHIMLDLFCSTLSNYV